MSGVGDLQKLTFGRAAVNRWVSGSLLRLRLPTSQSQRHHFFSTTSAIQQSRRARDGVWPAFCIIQKRKEGAMKTRRNVKAGIKRLLRKFWEDGGNGNH